MSPKTADGDNCYIKEAVNVSPPGFCAVIFGSVCEAERRMIPAENVFYFFIATEKITQLVSTDCFSSLSPNYSLSISVTSNYSTTPPLPTSPLRHPDQHIFLTPNYTHHPAILYLVNEDVSVNLFVYFLI